VYAPTAEHVRALVQDSPIDGTIAAPSAREAVLGADVVVAATNSRVPVLERSWLGGGAHVNAVGASSPATCELDVATVADAAVFCDSRESVLAEAGEFRLAVQEGAIGGEEHVRAELGEVLAGRRPGRGDPGELTVFRSLGIAVEDLAAAQLTVERARAAGLGVEVEL
jgi:ornithine cyclodeaminase